MTAAATPADSSSRLARPVRAARRAGHASTTPVTWSRSRLPGPAVAQAGVPVSEAVVSLGVVVLVFGALAVVTRAWVVAAVLGAVVLAAVAYVLWARRVVVGESYVAVRQLGRYHVASADRLRHLELKPSQHGGVLVLHTDDGRSMRLRQVEVARPEVNAALRAMADTSSDSTHDRRVEELLDLPYEEHRLRHRYAADLIG